MRARVTFMVLGLTVALGLHAPASSGEIDTSSKPCKADPTILYNAKTGEMAALYSLKAGMVCLEWHDEQTERLLDWQTLTGNSRPTRT